jgi:hypothetical protein
MNPQSCSYTECLCKTCGECEEIDGECLIAALNCDECREYELCPIEDCIFYWRRGESCAKNQSLAADISLST